MSRQYLGSVDLQQQCETDFSNCLQKSTLVNYGPTMDSRKLTQRIVIAAAGPLVIMAGVGSVGLLGQADADDPTCVPSATDSCPDRANLVSTQPPAQRHLQTYCQGAGMAGTHCFQRWVP
jgi:hypothetical protein